MINENGKLSRRAIMASLAIVPAFSTSVAFAKPAPYDAELISLGRQFDAIAAAIDDVIEGRGKLTNEIEMLGSIETAITATPAKTMEGLCVKARAACWALLGDLELTEESTLDRRMGLSIVRDLIRLHAPKLEQQNALKGLAEQE